MGEPAAISLYFMKNVSRPSAGPTKVPSSRYLDFMSKDGTSSMIG